MSRGAAVAAVLAAVALAGCQGKTMDSWIKEKMTPTPMATHVARVESTKPDERRESLQTVAANADARSVASVIKLYCLVVTTDEDPVVRAAAARGLGKMQGEGIVEALGKAATRDASPYVRCDAVASLGQVGKPEAVPVLAYVLANDTSEDVRIAAAIALRQFKDKAAVDALLAALPDANLAISYRAWESLRYMTGQGLPRQVEPWKEFLATVDDPFVLYGKPPLMTKGMNQRPQFTKGPAQFIRDLFKKDPRQAELE